MISSPEPPDRESLLAWKAWCALNELASFLWNRYEDAFVTFCIAKETPPDDPDSLDEFEEPEKEDPIPF